MTHPNILEYERMKAKERQSASLKQGHSLPSSPPGDNGGGGGTTDQKLAAKAGVGAMTISRAIRVRKLGTEEVPKAVESGEVKLNMAAKIVKLNPAAQKRVLVGSRRDPTKSRRDERSGLKSEDANHLSPESRANSSLRFFTGFQGT